MKKIPASKTLTTSLALLLTCAIAYKPIEAGLIAPAIAAQSETDTLASPRPASPVSPSVAPSQGNRPTEDPEFPWALMLLPFLGGLTWWVLKQPRPSSGVVPRVAAPTAPIAPVVLKEPLIDERTEIEHSALTDARAVRAKDPAPERDGLTQIEVPVKPDNSATSVLSEEVIPLLEERLVVNFHRRKIGEVVVRKEIETCIVEVPVRRERLIVEQISPEYEKLAVVDLGSTAETSNSSERRLSPTIQANFGSINAAIEFLKSITDQPSLGAASVPIGLILADQCLQSGYREWLKQHAS
jgi:Domain of unknown function (DUF2382)